MRIVFAGIIGRYPWGGVTWCSLMYLHGLRKLGHDVWYLEDTGECNYDPEANAIATEPSYALRYIQESLRRFGFGDRWCYVDYRGDHHGIDKPQWEEICRSADVFLVLSGGCWNWRDAYLSIPVKAFIDSDPAFTQLAIAKARDEAEANEGKKWYVDFFRTYDRLFTFGNAIGTPGCDVPTAGFKWIPTWQPVHTDLWEVAGFHRARNVWSTLMTWKIESFTDIGGNKDEEFLRVLDLANRLKQEGGPTIELAINGPKEFLREHGWQCIDAFPVSRDLWEYCKYVVSSRAEFSVAKKTYVRTRCGWFSDRTECYLAAARPAVVQDTGFSEFLPTGEGLFSWSDPDEALEAIRAVESDYDRHAAAAHTLAREHFHDSLVLKRLLEKLG